MKGFLKYTLATVAGLILYSIISSFVFMGIIGVITMASKGGEVTIKPNSILHLQLNKTIIDRANNDPFSNFDFATMELANPLGLNEILKSIDKAKNDENIKGIYLDLSYIPAGIASIEEIRNSLLSFKESGKFIYAYSDYITQSAYYLASVSDKIYMNPVGAFSLQGLRAEVAFFKGAMEKIGIEPVMFRHGKFKSAIEPFMLDKMSDDNKEQTRTFVQSIWDYMLKQMAEQRNIEAEELNKMIDEAKIRDPKTGVENKMIDELLYKDEMIAKLVEAAGIGDEKDLRLVKLNKYKKVKEETSKKKDERKKIAIVYASGEVIMGKGREGKLGAETISKALKKAREDSSIRAIVFRINSPGGSALASDIIWREAVLAQKTKPLVVSMGDLAASGGYYIACPADAIVSNHTTLTGSIGVFGLMFNNEKLMNQKLGITFDGIKTNKYADIGNPHRKMRADEKEIIQQGVEDVYKTFITHVGEGRKMTTKAVDEIGQGRVWSGINAKQIGLIDEFGGIQKAIKMAAEKAGLEDYKLLELPQQKDAFEQLLSQMVDNAKVHFLKKELGENYKIYGKIKDLQKSQGIQAKMPYDIELY